MSKTFLLLAAALLLVACSATAPGAPPSSPTIPPTPPGPTPSDGAPPPSATTLDGRVFLSVSVTKAGVERPLVPGTRIRLDFGKDGRLGVAAGCNTGGGTYTVDGARMSLGPIALTKKACKGASAEVERAIVATLGVDRLTWEIDATTLWLRSGDAGLGLTANG